MDIDKRIELINQIHRERTSLNDTNFWGRIGDNVFLTKESASAGAERITRR